MKLIVMLGLIITLTPGCRKHYEPTFKNITSSYRAEKEGVEVSVTALSTAESYELFGSNLPSQGYQPFHVHIFNKSADIFVMDWQHIAVPLTADFVIKDYTHYPTWWLTFTGGLLAAIYCWQLIPLVVIPSAYYMSHYNKDMEMMLEHYNMKHHEPIQILPHAHVDRIFFVCGWKPGLSFDLGFVNKDTGHFIKFVVKP